MYLNRAKFSKLHGDLVLTIYHHTLSIFLCVSFSPVICLGRIYWKVLPDLCKCHFFIKHHPQIFHITSSFKLLSWIFLKLTHILIVALFYLSEIYQVFWTALVLLLELILFPFIVWYADSNLFFFSPLSLEIITVWFFSVHCFIEILYWVRRNTCIRYFFVNCGNIKKPEKLSYSLSFDSQVKGAFPKKRL